ncbi:MAG: site-specific DNA-methyltransferase, partial [Rhodoblastus sp.]
MSASPEIIRDSIIGFLSAISGDASTEEITTAVRSKVGGIAPSSVRSYLSLNTPATFERTGRGRYRLQIAFYPRVTNARPLAVAKPEQIGKARLYHADCFEWLAQQEPASIQAVVTDPPYGLVEDTAKETEKLRAGKGGVWRIPPSFDGHKRAPLPRFTVLTDADRLELHQFFKRLALLVSRVAVPGANVLVASNPLLAHIVASAMVEGGLELRGYLA